MLAPAPATSPSPTAHLSTIFSPGDLVVSVHAAQDWRWARLPHGFAC
jgi:hypothetical protein